MERWSSMRVTPEVVFQPRQHADDGIVRVNLEREVGGLFPCGMNTIAVWLLWHEWWQTSLASLCEAGRACCTSSLPCPAASALGTGMAWACGWMDEWAVLQDLAQSPCSLKVQSVRAAGSVGPWDPFWRVLLAFRS